MKLYLQSIVDSIQFETLPTEWLNFDFVKFSKEKVLFDYQQQALKNAIKALYKYYNDCGQDKKRFFEFYRNNGLTENLDFKFNGNKKYKIFEEYDKDYKIEDNKISFHNFINRMSFWMATGSGKTLVVIKLIDIIGNLVKNGIIPKGDILFLTYREDLIEQFKSHINDFNYSNNEVSINLYSLKDYEQVKRGCRLKFSHEIDIFYYRSDLISDEQKDKIINFRNYDNSGNWYILLDEAHKGEKEDSKRQLYYSILSRNGFLFNFSATFTDAIDFATCVFNFNLEQFILSGYGKNIFVTQSNIELHSDVNEFTDEQKQIIIIKILLLHTLIKKFKPNGYYHNPLILTLVNSVNTEDSDLELFFREIAKIAKEGINEDLLSKAKSELKEDFKNNYEFTKDSITYDITLLEEIDFKEVLKYVYNSETIGNIEVLKLPNNKQEIIFKLTTGEKPFALIKIGDITEWIKNKLSGYEIFEKYDDESVFNRLNTNDNDINILMGSRAFYEGWDSNRPNIILYINIGKGTDAKKFVLQSLGRGIRIEPLPNKRKRLKFLYNNKEINDTEFDAIKDKVSLIETLFVYGTKAKNIQDVLDTLKKEKAEEELIGELFQINPDIFDKILLIPSYKTSDIMLVDEDYLLKFTMNENDLKLLDNYFNFINDKVMIMKFGCDPKTLEKIRSSFSNSINSKYYNLDNNIKSIGNPEILLRNIIKYFSLRSEELKEFKKLEDEIIHFRNIRISKDKLEKLSEKIEKVKRYPNKKLKKDLLKSRFNSNEIKLEEYTEQVEKLSLDFPKELKEDKLCIKYIQNHYYIPLCISNDEKISYITHIIKKESEVKFIEVLDKYLQDKDNIFNRFDWWFFSKIDETLDDVYIPYYQSKTNKIEKFKPDFIFWLKKENNYTILFIDPKSMEYSDAYRKIDGYSRIFEIEQKGEKVCKNFSVDKFNVQVKLFLKVNNCAGVLEQYKKYCFENFDDLFQKCSNIS